MTTITEVLAAHVLLGEYEEPSSGYQCSCGVPCPFDEDDESGLEELAWHHSHVESQLLIWLSDQLTHVGMAALVREGLQQVPVLRSVDVVTDHIRTKAAEAALVAVSAGLGLPATNAAREVNRKARETGEVA